MAASMKLGSKTEGFLRHGQAWFCTTGLPSDVTVKVEEMSFHLHKFPLMSKSGKLADLITRASATLNSRNSRSEIEEEDEEDRIPVIHLPDIPGGTEAFELAAKFCYGMKLELTASNIVLLRCAAEYLEMTEELGEGNLIVKAEGFLNQVVLRSWKDSVRALQSCEKVLDYADRLQIVKRCVDSISSKACTDPSLFGWPLMDQHLTMQSPGGSVLWNGISTGARPRNARSDWWYEDVAALSLNMFQRLVKAMEVRGLKPEIIAGAVMSYGKRYLPGLNRRQSSGSTSGFTRGYNTALPEVDQRSLLESVEQLLPSQKGVVPVRFLFGLLRLSMLLNASSECKSNLEMRIGMQLDQAHLDDLLMPNYSYTVETLYDLDVVQRIVEHFLRSEAMSSLVSSSYEIEGSPPVSAAVTPVMQVAKLLDAYLAEVAPDPNLKMNKFQDLAEALPDFARVVDDGLYRAIDIYLKTHQWLTEIEREKLCRSMDCQKLSLEACTHAAQNERLPLRVVIQVLFFEQLQLRTAIAGCFLVSENVESSSRAPNRQRENPDSAHPSSTLRGEGWANVLRENQVMKVDMDKMRNRVKELEKECTQMRQEIEKLGRGRSSSSSSIPSFSLAKKLGCRTKPQILKPQSVVKSQATTLAAALESQSLESFEKGSMTEKGSVKKTDRRQQQQQQHRRSQSSLA